MKLYGELAEYYFFIESNHRDIHNDINLIRTYMNGLIQPAVLDLGCGTGEHLNALRRFGAKCTGIDISSEMLEVAKKRFTTGIEFHQRDFSTFDYYNEFDIIISLFGSMVYLQNDSDVDTFFWNTWRALKPDGIGIFELWHSIPVKKIGNRPLTHVSKTNYNNVIIDRERGFTIIEDEKRTLVRVDYIYRLTAGGRTDIYNDTHIMRAFTLDEITTFIKSNGLEIKNVYSNSLKEKFNENSNKMLIIFQKKS